MREKTWAEWTDVLGNTYRPGDLVAIAVINGRSPQLVIARVEKINRVNSSGEEITVRAWFEHDEPIKKTRIRKTYDHNYRSYTETEEEYLEKGAYRDVPSCSVQATPLIDARGFGRYGQNEDGTNRKITYKIPENIIRVEQ